MRGRWLDPFAAPLAKDLVDSHRVSTFCAEAGFIRRRRGLWLLREPGIRQYRMIEELIGVARYFDPIKNQADESRNASEDMNDRNEPANVQHGYGESEVHSCRSYLHWDCG